MAEWEEALATRDGVFLQLILLAGFLFIVYRLFIAGRRLIWRIVTITLGIALFLALLVISMVNVLLWSPT